MKFFLLDPMQLYLHRRLSNPESPYARLESLLFKLRTWPNRIVPDTLETSLADKRVSESKILSRRPDSSSPLIKRRGLYHLNPNHERNKIGYRTLTWSV